MPILKRQLDLQSISSGGRNLRIDFNMLQIVAVMAAFFFAICKKSSGHCRAHMRPYFPFFAKHNFL
jgi:hypothetical protein